MAATTTCDPAKGITLSAKQLVSVVAAAIICSGSGGAITALANSDAAQNEKIRANEDGVKKLQKQVDVLVEGNAEVRTKVVGIEDDVDEIKGDTKEIRQLLDRLLGKLDAEHAR